MIDEEKILSIVAKEHDYQKEFHLENVKAALKWLNESICEMRAPNQIVGNIVKYKDIRCMITANDFRFGATVHIRPLSMNDEIVEKMKGARKTLDFAKLKD